MGDNTACSGLEVPEVSWTLWEELLALVLFQEVQCKLTTFFALKHRAMNSLSEGMHVASSVVLVHLIAAQ